MSIRFEGKRLAAAQVGFPESEWRGPTVTPDSIRALRANHFFAPGPKRILSLDGGGVRGIISLAFLERIEQILRERSGQAGFRLAEYFDLAGGTSTGAIIAAGVALGFSSSALIDMYLNVSQEGFRRNRWMGGTLAPKFDAVALRRAIVGQFGMETLGSNNLHCGLGVVTKRLDTGSVWLFHNHPDGAYFDSKEPVPGFAPNKDLLLADLLRASTAAPTYFAPELLEISGGVRGLFVDGGVSPHNNPALLLTMLANLKGYGFRWPLGADRLMMVSLGTGSPRSRPPFRGFSRTSPVLLAVESLRSIIEDANWLTQTVLQWMSDSPIPWSIDSEIGTMSEDIASGSPLLTYLRYDAPLSAEAPGFATASSSETGNLDDLAEMDRPDLAPRLLEFGRQAAAARVKPEHFPERFDLANGPAERLPDL